MKSINIARDFSTLPGPRFKDEGPHSGEQFRLEHLEPAFLAARAAGEKLEIQLDGVEFGYPTSFLEEAFGGLARAHEPKAVIDTLVLVSEDEPLLIREIHRYIEQANDARPPRERVADSSGTR